VVDLLRPLDALTKRIESPTVTRAASEAMADELQRATAQRIGADLSLSRMPGSRARFQATNSKGVAEVTPSGSAWTIANKGRRTVRGATGTPQRPLRTPFGPRMSVRGSTSAGFDILGRARSSVFDAGKDATIKAVRSGR
jgi:hypothetical protein